MQEIRRITLDQDILDAIASDDDERLTELEDELSYSDDFESMLGCYHDSGQVTYEITNIEVDEDGQGTLEVSYTAHKYSGCKDIDLDEEDDMIVDISIDMTTGEMTLTGADIPDRDPDTY
jgi:hypothetical protein